MEIDANRRRAEEERGQLRTKNGAYRAEIEELVKENKRMIAEKTTLNSRLTSLRQLNKQLERKVDHMSQPVKQNPIYLEMEKKAGHHEKWAQDLEEKLQFTVEKFEEQN